jgi:hypothetical protein
MSFSVLSLINSYDAFAKIHSTTAPSLSGRPSLFAKRIATQIFWVF